MRADPRLHSIVFGLRVSADDDCPTSVVLGGWRQQLHVTVQRIWLFAVDREIHQRRSRHRAFALAPKLVYLAINPIARDWMAKRQSSSGDVQFNEPPNSSPGSQARD